MVASRQGLNPLDFYFATFTGIEGAHMQTQHRHILTGTLALVAALALSACDKHDERTAGQKLDSAIATTEAKTEAAQAETKKNVADMKAGAKEAMGEAKADAKATGKAIETSAIDATITAKVNAALVADDKLKALKIDVDTSAGAVTLKGTAPDADSMGRASVLAKAVDGVKSVNNLLVVSKS
jgi:hyperosmotically inducible protein